MAQSGRGRIECRRPRAPTAPRRELRIACIDYIMMISSPISGDSRPHISAGLQWLAFGGDRRTGRQAKISSHDNLGNLLTFASTTRHPLRNPLIVLLSVKASLRAAEIAKLTWQMMLTSSREIGSVIELRDSIAKKSSGRPLPVNPGLCGALINLARSPSGA